MMEKPRPLAIDAAALIGYIMDKGWFEGPVKIHMDRIEDAIEERGGMAFDKEETVDWAFRMITLKFPFDPRDDEVLRDLLADAYSALAEKHGMAEVG